MFPRSPNLTAFICLLVGLMCTTVWCGDQRTILGVGSPHTHTPVGPETGLRLSSLAASTCIHWTVSLTLGSQFWRRFVRHSCLLHSPDFSLYPSVPARLSFCSCAITLWQKQRAGERAYYGSQVKEAILQWEAARQQELEAATFMWHPQSGTEDDKCQPSAHLLHVQDPQPRESVNVIKTLRGSPSRRF